MLSDASPDNGALPRPLQGRSKEIAFVNRLVSDIGFGQKPKEASLASR
jgi:hypothetical protein